VNPKPSEDEPLFVDDLSDFDMEEILQESRKATEKAADGEMTKEISTQEPSNTVELDEFEDEMDALNDVADLHE
jgi:hypothetical protein